MQCDKATLVTHASHVARGAAHPPNPWVRAPDHLMQHLEPRVGVHVHAGGGQRVGQAQREGDELAAPGRLLPLQTPGMKADGVHAQHIGQHHLRYIAVPWGRERFDTGPKQRQTAARVVSMLDVRTSTCPEAECTPVQHAIEQEVWRNQ